ncbi:hypothetical protein PF007_g26734 [Phytophthora fragariae]|uniref:Uncharacterized protein n=1 Tax=Phytophthora fragariae TaxID=53985 RepID=A0A6A3Q8S5_9STRA|nr:hypothetical protein PF007_g26734 [Phytophthora fragariae]KAE9189202.1 hypothetical protein PF004_g22283 [Phytophthora fragariae]
MKDSGPAAFRLVFKRFVELASNVHKVWSVSEHIAVVQSLPNARGEKSHFDFQSSETANAAVEHEWVQASLLLVLEPDTKLIVVSEGFAGAALSGKCTALEDLSPGDVVVYRGDLPHADVPYKDGNVRIQGLINVDGVDHDEGVVERVAWAVYRCHHCFRNCVDKRDMTNHERFCSANPAKAAIAAKRKRNNDKGAYCARCDRHFGKKNTFHAHQCAGTSADAEAEEKEE